MSSERVRELLNFIEKSPSCFHVAANMAAELEKAGFQRLYERDSWKLKKGGKYYTIRNGSSIAAFSLPENSWTGFRILASHGDSPAFRLKENPELELEGRLVRLNVEKYGGMLMSTWFDRPLSVAGRLLVREGNRIVSRLVNVERDLVLIPSLAIHMNRKANEGYAYNAQKDMLPLFSGGRKGRWIETAAENAGVSPEQILGSDLFLYNREKGSIWGADHEFYSSSRLDDQACAFASLKGFINAVNEHFITVHCVFDNEEVGSQTKQGAASTFLRDVLERILISSGTDREDFFRMLASSCMLSADNAHSVHPNHPDKSDVSNRPYLNGGIVLKYAASQKYCTDGSSAAFLTELCHRARISCQTFFNRSDMAGGSTLGNIAGLHVSVPAVDIGLPQLAMHSAYETAGVKDLEDMIRLAGEFFTSDLIMEE
ncbi:MAG: M18 family aminopeptidase [Ruminococcus sp.]|jgi:aspartyl aminopeptidase